MSSTDYSTRMIQARMRIERMQQLERESGFGTPEGASIFEHLRTAQAALEAGIIRHDWASVEEAKVMVDDVLKRIKQDGWMELYDLRQEP